MKRKRRCSDNSKERLAEMEEVKLLLVSLLLAPSCLDDLGGEEQLFQLSSTSALKLNKAGRKKKKERIEVRWSGFLSGQCKNEGIKSKLRKWRKNKGRRVFKLNFWRRNWELNCFVRFCFCRGEWKGFLEKWEVVKRGRWREKDKAVRSVLQMQRRWRKELENFRKKKWEFEV